METIENIHFSRTCEHPLIRVEMYKCLFCDETIISDPYEKWGTGTTDDFGHDCQLSWRHIGNPRLSNLVFDKYYKRKVYPKIEYIGKVELKECEIEELIN